MLKLMDVESFQHIHAVRNLRGSRLPRGRALPAEEIRQLFVVCETDRSSLGPRDAAMLAVLLGCGLRRSELVGLSLSDVVMNERALKVLGKGNKERLAYMPAGTNDLIPRMARSRPRQRIDSMMRPAERSLRSSSCRWCSRRSRSILFNY